MIHSTLGRTLILAATLLPGRLAAGGDEQRLAEAVAAIVRADYRGDRAELARQAEAISSISGRKLSPFRAYWRAFAFWRRGINGYNEVPRPADVREDFERGAAHARAALALDETFEDARAALAGCLMGQAFLPDELPADSRTALLQEMRAVMKTVQERSEGNPRSLWMVGGSQAFAPPPYGDKAKAAATYRLGLEAARAEALSPKRRDPWVPSWGAPELLMSLAFLHTMGAPDPAVARAYAEGALSMAPDWHFVRDILLPNIDKLTTNP